MGALFKGILHFQQSVMLVVATFFFAIMMSPAFAEQKPSLPAPDTVQSTGAWFFVPNNFPPSGITSLYDGYPSGQAACDAYASWSYGPGSTASLNFLQIPGFAAQGFCSGYSAYNDWVAGGYLGVKLVVGHFQNCPPGYRSNDPGFGYISDTSFTCINMGAPRQCPPVPPGEQAFTLDPGELTCSRPDQCQPPDAFDSATGQCVKCPIDPLPKLPADDLCALSLEKGRGKDVDGKCPKPSDLLTGPNGQLQCFANKIAATNATAMPKIPYSGPSAIIRNPAYQKHLQQIWDKMIELDNLRDPVKIEACQALRDKVAAEKGCDSSDSCDGVFSAGSHGIDYRPADSSNHSDGTAFDVPKKTIKGIISELTPLPPAPMTPQQKLQFKRFVISAWLASPTACNLKWGGSFQDPDYVHFQLP